MIHYFLIIYDIIIVSDFLIGAFFKTQLLSEKQLGINYFMQIFLVFHRKL